LAERKAFLLRIPPELHDALEHWAADELRSVNGQIEVVLTEAVRRAGRTPKRTRRPAK